MPLRDRIIQLLEDNRGLVVVLFCLPASFIFDLILSVRLWVRRRFQSAPQLHDKRVKDIQQQVLKWNENKSGNFMCTARPNWLSLSTTFFTKDKCDQIAINLYDILELNEEKRTIRVEPLVTVRDVTRYLLPKGYTLAVTLEIGDATCGGLALAVGMTTYSHKVGLYQETVESYEVVLGDGRCVNATRDNEYADLYNTLPWSHGTLGFLVSLELQIIPVKPYVHLEYIPVHGQKEICDRMRELSGAKDKNQKVPDYLEATLFSADSAVLMIGNFADVQNEEQKSKVNHIARWYKPWFYKHTESFLHKKGEEYIPLEEYLLRHNRAIFWVVKAMIPFGNNPIFRFFLGWLCPPKPAFLKFTTTQGIREMTFTKQARVYYEYSSVEPVFISRGAWVELYGRLSICDVFQDIVLPMTVLEKSINLATELFDTFPLLIYPCRIYDHGQHTGQLRSPRADQMTPDSNYGMFYDLGVYGIPGKVRRKQPYNAATAMRHMEKFIRDCGGYSFLYADYCMDESELSEMFDLTLYNQVRRKYAAEGAFPNLYNKTRPADMDLIAVAQKYEDMAK